MAEPRNHEEDAQAKTFAWQTLSAKSKQIKTNTINFLTLHPSNNSEIVNLLCWALTLHQTIFGEFLFAMGLWLAVMGSSLVSLVSLGLGSLGLSLEKGASLGKFLTGLV